MLNFEDFQPGHFGTFGPRYVSREEIVAFAAEFDPQPMHMDDQGGAESLLGGLSASGWQQCGIMMRMMVDGFIGRASSLGSPGVEEVRWLAPLRAGDTVSLEVEVVSARLSKSRQGVGIVVFKCTMQNTAGIRLCEVTSTVMVGSRNQVSAE